MEIESLELEIQDRGLVEAYQNALIAILELDMSLFNSAIELGMLDIEIPNNSFRWNAHAYLWKFSRATADQKRQAAKQVGITVD